MKKRSLPQSLEQKQLDQRQATIDKVQQAIDELKAEKAIVKIKKLVEVTGLSRSVFNKDHIKEVLKKNQVCQYEPKNLLDITPSDDERMITLEKKLIFMTAKFNDEYKRRLRIQKEKEELEEDYQLLLGKYHRVVANARNYGVPVDSD